MMLKGNRFQNAIRHVRTSRPVITKTERMLTPPAQQQRRSIANAKGEQRCVDELTMERRRQKVAIWTGFCGFWWWHDEQIAKGFKGSEQGTWERITAVS